MLNHDSPDPLDRLAARGQTDGRTIERPHRQKHACPYSFPSPPIRLIETISTSLDGWEARSEKRSIQKQASTKKPSVSSVCSPSPSLPPFQCGRHISITLREETEWDQHKGGQDSSSMSNLRAAVIQLSRPYRGPGQASINVEIVADQLLSGIT